MPDESDMLVTVGRYNESVYAHLVKTMLESEGIPVAVSGDGLSNIIGTDGLSAGSWVILQVHKSDYERAIQVLTKKPVQNTDEDEADEYRVEFKGKEPTLEGLQCPVCGSRETCRPTSSTTKFLFALLALFLLDFGSWRRLNKWKCLDCGHEWEGK